jgi:ATP-dependent helicase Lhr and Lhr-like helicase
MSALSSFHPAVRAWFEQALGAPTLAQSQGWLEIAKGKDTLIAAPTGHGKTLAAFLSSIDALVKKAEEGGLGAGIEVVYVSPLKALSSDVQKNLERPLAGIREAMSSLGSEPPPLRMALRTGDTTPAARAAIVKKPPHILITTPESLYLMLTAPRPRELLRTVRTVIVDEVHALMRDKRGSHLALSLARLDAVAEVRPQRIGLSATMNPIEEAARFLVGTGRPCAIVDVGHRRDLDLRIELPGTDLEAVATNEQWAEIHARLAALVLEHRTTLVFVNTRRMAERIAHNLAERLGEASVGAHHGSLSKERRLALETRLKAGEMRAIVATASLELGIDVGTVDLVCQIGSPRATTTFLQRIGRSGHALGRTARGRLFATSRDELCECAALLRAIAAGHLDRLAPPKAPLDILAQQIAAECSARDWEEDQLFELVRQAAPYADLDRKAFDDIVLLLCEGPAPRLGRGRALLHRDGVHGVLRGRRSARIVAVTNGGAIPDVADYRVLLDPDDTLVGTVNEDWAIESMAGDVFLLGSHSWRIRRVESRSGVVRVEDAKGQAPNVPFWLGEAPGRPWELSLEVSRLRTDIVARLDEGDRGREWLAAECGLEPEGAAQLVDYIAAERDALGVVPSVDEVVFERFFDEAGGMQLVVHAPFGARVNRAFGLALRKRFCVNFDFELQAAATDDAIVLSLGTAHSFALSDAFSFVRSHQLRATLEQAILPAPMFGTRWRWNATRALAVLRHANGKKVPPFLQRMRSDDLLAAVFPAQTACQENQAGPREIPEHPLIKQTVDDCLFEAMDIDRLHGLLERMEEGTLRLHARDTTEPSPFAHEILNAKPYAFLDDAPLEERRTRALSLRRTLPEHQRDLGALDAEAIARVVAEASPDPRDPDEVHDVLLGHIVLRAPRAWDAWVDELIRGGRASRVHTVAGEFVFAAEHRATVAALYPDAKIAPPLAPSPRSDGRAHGNREEAMLAVVRGHSETSGPFNAPLLAHDLGLEEWEVASAVGQLESEGVLLRGRFTPAGELEELCDRRLLARIHRYTLDRLRREIEPVSAQDFMRYLLRRHHLDPRSRAGGRAGLRDAIAMLQGFEIAAASWETEVLAPRVAGYRSEWLDELCLAGEVTYCRLSLRRAPSPRAEGHDAPATQTRGSTSRATPLAIARRKDLGWLLEAVRGTTAPDPPTSEASLVTLEALRKRGALFFEDLEVATGLDRPNLTSALWDVVGLGLVAPDGFQPMRDLMSVGRSARRRRARTVSGRWALVHHLEPEPLAEDVLADRVAEQLLARYGIVFRGLSERESFAVPWRNVLRALRRREARGLVRGGRFVSGVMGEQYALPEAVDALRRARRDDRTELTLRVSATDPLNLVGILTPGPRIPAHAGAWVVLCDGATVPTPVANEGRRMFAGV